ncbi:hypothetical protein ECG_09676 [Echinococcus granulosus]|nr:hypothetical protein ECG_09676 [Echinococcus granulosus]
MFDCDKELTPPYLLDSHGLNTTARSDASLQQPHPYLTASQIYVTRLNLDISCLTRHGGEQCWINYSNSHPIYPHQIFQVSHVLAFMTTLQSRKVKSVQCTAVSWKEEIKCSAEASQG